MKRVRDNQPDEMGTWQRVRDNFSHMRPLKYICHYVQSISRFHMLKISNITLKQSSAECY